MLKEFLLEIGTEEIPSRFMPGVLADMEDLINKELETLRIGFGGTRVFGTPRRLVLYIDNVSNRQEDIYVNVVGPSIKVAFDESGNPTKAAIGFARAQGVDLTDLERVTTPKGEYVEFVSAFCASEKREVLSSLR